MLFDIADINKNIDLLNSIENHNYYPFNLNDNLIDNIIETKKEIELEYIKNYIFIDKDKNQKIKGANINEINEINKVTIYII